MQLYGKYALNLGTQHHYVAKSDCLFIWKWHIVFSSSAYPVFFQSDQKFSDQIVRTEFVVGKNTGIDCFCDTIAYKSDLKWWIALTEVIPKCGYTWTKSTKQLPKTIFVPSNLLKLTVHKFFALTRNYKVNVDWIM